MFSSNWRYIPAATITWFVVQLPPTDFVLSSPGRIRESRLSVTFPRYITHSCSWDSWPSSVALQPLRSPTETIRNRIFRQEHCQFPEQWIVAETECRTVKVVLSQVFESTRPLIICGVRAQKSTKLANSHCVQQWTSVAHLSARVVALCDCAKLSLRCFDKR